VELAALAFFGGPIIDVPQAATLPCGSPPFFKLLAAPIHRSCSVVSLVVASESKDGISDNGKGDCTRYSAPQGSNQSTSTTFIPALDGAIGQDNAQAHESGQDGTGDKQAAVHECNFHFTSQNRMVFASDRSE